MHVTGFQTRALLLLAAAVTLAVYWPGLSGHFVFDDFSNTTQIHLNTLDWEHLADVAFSNASGRLLRPLANASFALNYYFFGPEPWSYKFTNVLIHLLCGFLVFALVRRILTALDCDETTVRVGALLAATGWLLHPIQVSTVLYTVQRMAQLSALFSLAALWAYMAGRGRLAGGDRTGWWYMALAFGVAAPLGLASKESAALIPLFILALELFVYRFQCPETGARRDLLVVWGLGVALPLLLGTLYVLTHFPDFLASYELRDFTMLERLLTQARALWFYLYLIFVPFPENLGFYHDDFVVSRGLDTVTVAALAGIGMLLAAMVALRRRAPVISFGIAWFFVAHALESSFIGLEMVFEHRNYLALLGPALVVGHGAARLSRAAFSSPVLRRVALVAPLVLLGGMTWSQVQRWSSIHDFLASHALNNPDSARANAELAAWYTLTENWEKAEEHLAKFEALLPDDPATPLMRIQLQCRQDSIEDAGIDAAVLRIGETAHPGHLAQKLTLMTTQWLRPGECPALTAQQLLRLIDATVARPDIASLPRIAGNLHGFRGAALRRQGEHEAAIDAFTRAVELKPRDADLLLLRAYTELSLRRYEDLGRTIEHLRRVDASNLRYSGHHIDELETSLAQARMLEQELPALGAACGRGEWPAADVEKTRVLLGSSDTVWIVLPLLEQLMVTLISESCVPSSSDSALGLLSAVEQNSNLSDYEPGRFQLRVLQARLLNVGNRPEEALLAYEQAVALIPQDFQTLYEMAYLQLNMGRIDEARATVEQMWVLESATQQGNDSRLAELEGYIDGASQ